jgi:hypothetical protein
MPAAPTFDFKAYVLQQWDYSARQTRQYVESLTSDLTDDELNWQSAPGIHSIWHHVWHAFLSVDYLFAHAFGIPPHWEEGSWQSRIDLSSMKRAFDHSDLAYGYCPRFVICDVPDSLVDELRAPHLPEFLAYVDQILARCGRVLHEASDEDLFAEFLAYGRMSPRVSAARFNHVYRHIGMMESVRGLIRGPGQGSATS